MIRILVLVLLLGGCAHLPEAPERPVAAHRGEPVSRLCFARSLSGFEVIDDQHVLVSRGRQRFLLTLRSFCPELRFAQRIAVSSFAGCLSAGDKLLAWPMGQGPRDGLPGTCLIDGIHLWHHDVAPAPARTGENGAAP